MLLSSMPYPVLAAAREGSFGGDAGGGHAAGGEFSGVEVPLVVAGGIGELACVYGVGVDAVAVGERAEVPVSVRLLAVGDAPVSASDVDALGGVLVFGLVVHVDALAGFEVCVAAGRVHDLVDAVDEVGDVWFGAGGGVVPCAGVGDELVELSAPCVVLAGDACGDVAEGDGGGGLVAGEVYSICGMRPSRRRGVGKLVSMMWTVSPMSVPSALTPAAARLVTSHSYETTGWLRVLSASLVNVRSCLGSSQSGNSASASLWMRVPLG